MRDVTRLILQIFGVSYLCEKFQAIYQMIAGIGIG